MKTKGLLVQIADGDGEDVLTIDEDGRLSLLRDDAPEFIAACAREVKYQGDPRTGLLLAVLAVVAHIVKEPSGQ